MLAYETDGLPVDLAYQKVIQNRFFEFIDNQTVTVNNNYRWDEIFTDENIELYVGKDFSIATTQFLSNIVLLNDLPLAVNLFSDEYDILTNIQAFDVDDLTLPNYVHNNYYEYDFSIQFKICNFNQT
jgi:hypothetical protein